MALMQITSAPTCCKVSIISGWPQDADENVFSYDDEPSPDALILDMYETWINVEKYKVKHLYTSKAYLVTLTDEQTIGRTVCERLGFEEVPMKCTVDLFHVYGEDLIQALNREAKAIKAKRAKLKKKTVKKTKKKLGLAAGTLHTGTGGLRAGWSI